MQQSMGLELPHYDCKVDCTFFELFKSIDELFECEQLTSEDVDNLKLACKKLHRIILNQVLCKKASMV